MPLLPTHLPRKRNPDMPIDPVTGALIGGIAGDFIGGLFGSSAQKKANKVNIMLTRENRAWMEYMSNSEWQRGVADMKAAGLNPMLGFSQGGASTPSTSAANVIPEDALGKSVHSAAAKAMQALALENMSAQNKLLWANKLNVDADTQNKLTSSQVIAGQAQEIDARIQQMAVQFKTAQAQYDITEEQLRQARLTTEQMRQMQPLLLQYQRLLNQAEELGMTQKEIDEEFAKQLGQESKFLQFLHQIFRMGK